MSFMRAYQAIERRRNSVADEYNNLRGNPMGYAAGERNRLAEILEVYDRVLDILDTVVPDAEPKE